MILNGLKFIYTVHRRSHTTSDSQHGKEGLFTVCSAQLRYAAEYPICEFSWVFSPIKRLILYHFHTLNTPLPTPPDTLYPTQLTYVRSSFLRGAHFSTKRCAPFFLELVRLHSTSDLRNPSSAYPLRPYVAMMFRKIRRLGVMG